VEPKKIETSKNSADKDPIPVDPAQAVKVKEILHLLVNAVSAAKIFPSDHQTVANFLSDLYGRLKTFLDENWKLELGIEEHAFTFGEKQVYEDPHPVKSLPFFFFKDGMQMLYFYKGLEKEELKGFLETIKKVAQLPPEEGDIVNALWEKDFANIRYLASDDFLGTKIGVGKRPLDIRVDKSEFYSGRIMLTPDDLEQVRTNALALEGTKEGEAEKTNLPGQDEISALLSPSDEKEMQEIESLLLSNRRISAEEEYLNLMVEIIYLEDRMEQFPAMAEVLKQHHQEAVQNNDFSRASLLLRSLHEIKDIFAKKDKRKADLVEGVIKEIGGETALAQLQQSLDLSTVADPESLFSYLRLIGPKAARIVADLFEQSKDPGFREKSLGLLKQMGQIDAEALMHLTQESRPILTKEIIAFLSQIQDKRVLLYMAKFLSYKNKSIKLEAIQTLGKIGDEATNKILLGFVSDADEDVRIAAAEKLKFFHDRQLLEHIFNLFSDKAFNKKSLKEKRAFFDFLNRSQSEQACDFLRKILKKYSLFPSPKQKEACLCAVRALEKMTIPAAKEVLKECARRRHGKIRKACLQALKNMAECDEPSSSEEKTT